MIRKIKALGLALVAVFAMSAVVASAASAANGTLTTFPAGSTVIASGVQVGEHVFTLTDQPLQPTVKCKKAVFDGVGTNSEAAGKNETVVVTPTYNECTAFSLPATVEHDGCTYVLHTKETTGKGGWHVTTDLVCPEGKAMTIKTATCEVQVAEQKGLTTSEVTNSGAAEPPTAMDLVLHTNIGSAAGSTKITYKVTKDGIGCPLSGVGHFTEGDYVGTTTVTAIDSTTGASVGTTLHD
jgi:hypothetical protein